MTLYDALCKYSSSDAYPFHMPGHKRRSAFLCDPAAIDITEIDGFDNLHHAEGILRDAQMRAASLYKSSESHFLVNGSTAGILSAIGVCSAPGRCLLMARNSHQSAYNAAALNRLRTEYLYPQNTPDHLLPTASGNRENTNHPRVPDDDVRNGPAGSDRNGPIDPAQVERALCQLQDQEVCAVFITSPTYDGVVSDVKQIAEIAHRHGLPLIVDEAHGAHFGMHKIFPESSVTLGADLVIHSLHKTLPALTQTALIHVNGPLVDRGRLRRLLSVYQTSSPSYVLMASIDQCIQLLTESGTALFDAYAKRLERFYAETRLKNLSFLPTDDPSRILIRTGAPSGPCPYASGYEMAGAEKENTKAATPGQGMSAMQLYHALRERFHIQPEMAAGSYVLMLSSVCDDDEGFSRLSEALRTLDEELGGSCTRHSVSVTWTKCDESTAVTTLPSGACCTIAKALDAKAEAVSALPSGACCTIAEALDAKAEAVSFLLAEGKISAEFLMLYPPGIPLLVPGERISGSLLRHVLNMKERGYSMVGPEDSSLRQIRVISHNDG